MTSSATARSQPGTTRQRPVTSLSYTRPRCSYGSANQGQPLVQPLLPTGGPKADSDQECGDEFLFSGNEMGFLPHFVDYARPIVRRLALRQTQIMATGASADISGPACLKRVDRCTRKFGLRTLCVGRPGMRQCGATCSNQACDEYRTNPGIHKWMPTRRRATKRSCWTKSRWLLDAAARSVDWIAPS